MWGTRHAFSDDMTENWKPGRPSLYNKENGVLVFQYHHDLSKKIVKEKIAKWMAKEGFILGKDYTMNGGQLRADVDAVAVWFKDPQSFVMMKLKYG